MAEAHPVGFRWVMKAKERGARVIGDKGERLRLRLVAEADRQPLSLLDDAPGPGRRRRGAVRDGAEPGGRLSALGPPAARTGQAEVAGRARSGGDRDRDLLARLAGGAVGRVPHRGHSDRGVPDAGRLARREGGHVHEHPAAVQFRDKALDPPGDARSELWFMHHLAKRVKAHYAGSSASQDWPIVNLKWDYPEHGDAREPDVRP